MHFMLSGCDLELFIYQAIHINDKVFHRYARLLQPCCSQTIPYALTFDKGAAAATALAKELNLLLLIDEKAGRKAAQEYDFTIIGSGGILLKAKQLAIIEEVHPILNELLDAGYRFSHELVKVLIKLANE